MTAVLTVTPAGTQAAMIDRVLAEKYPRHALPTIAGQYDMPLADLQAILNRHGYPDQTRLRRAVQQLRAADQLPPADQAADEPTVEVSRPRLVRVPVDHLEADPANLREHVAVRLPQNTTGHHEAADDIEQLADSIREQGLLQPIVVRRLNADPAVESRLVVVAGHRRLAAIRRLRWTHVDVLARPPMRPDEVVAAMLIENGQRRDLDPIEEARGIMRLRTTHHLTDLQVAKKIGRSQTYVSARLALLNLDAHQQEQIRNGELGITNAAGLGRLQAGKTRQSAKGNVTTPYFGPTHDLASKARARCRRIGHRVKIAGGEACGACWESVIRADERTHAQARNATADDCVTCGHPIDHAASAGGA